MVYNEKSVDHIVAFIMKGEKPVLNIFRYE